MRMLTTSDAISSRWMTCTGNMLAGETTGKPCVGSTSQSSIDSMSDLLPEPVSARSFYRPYWANGRSWAAFLSALARHRLAGVVAQGRVRYSPRLDERVARYRLERVMDLTSMG